ncbi:DNA polymerase IV [bacterium]|nr:DNA polymerase IV [bacterium]
MAPAAPLTPPIFDRAILHVDMDAFYASVEVLDDPSLRGRPVIVGGTPEGRGVVAAASYEARRFGVHSAMSAARAVRLCPDGVFLRGRMDRYAEVSAAVFAIFADFTPLVEPLSIDEAFLDVSGCGRLFGAPPEIGRRIRERIRDEIGLVASVGVAPNKFLAKLASDLEKPDGFVVIAPGTERELLAGLPVRRLWGVGKVLGGRLEADGIRLVADLLARPRAQLIRTYGDHMAQLLELAVGHDERPVIPSHAAKSIGNETTFGEDVADGEQLVGILHHLCDKVARRLRAHDFVASTLTLKARYPDFTTHTRSVTLPEPTDSDTEIRAQARDLLERALGRRGRPLRLIGITASNLGRPGGQPELFPDPQRVRQRDLDRVLDGVRDRFGAKLGRGLPRRPGS